ncbi:DUF695 domain-containing protein [Chryseobacterium camelliae]|uniref:DUF695 domain-containing protein n=1 Tax=Chryseobacterium camelliae TaxID=1265445 RepID=UPI00285D44CE|nr:DUF695 domain-containing protein [Chryseobacterium camelliae]MDR6513706.1 hypothetical protein [Chryseobacterium camelliae]
MNNDLKMVITDNDKWTISEGENDNKPFLLRFRPHLQPFCKIGLYNIRVALFLIYESDNPECLPSDGQFELFKELEDKLIENLESDLLAVLAFIYTGNNQKEWHFYTHQIDQFETRINNILDQFSYDNYIELQVENDPSWNEYQSVLSGAE